VLVDFSGQESSQLFSLEASHLGSSKILSSIILVSLIVVALPRMLSNRERAKQPLFAIPRGVVLVIAIFAAISFLVEGALLERSGNIRSALGRLPAGTGEAECSLPWRQAWLSLQRTGLP
jgi:hypothetical protein